jgi:hypothetical protein
MANIQQSEKKLREAQHFCGCLEQEIRKLNLGEECDFALSAYLSAARSVGESLRWEQQSLFDSWYPVWLASLSQDDRDFLDFCRRQRNFEVHRDGAAVNRGMEFLPDSQLGLTEPLHPFSRPQGRRRGVAAPTPSP